MLALRHISGSQRPLSCIFALLLAVSCSRGESAPVQQNGNPGGQGGQRGGGAARGSPFGRSSGPTAIEVHQIRTGSLAREITVAGILAPVRTVGVNAQLGGALNAVRVEEGDVVREGDILAEVDSRELAAQLRSAEASLALAKSTAERSAALFKDRVVTAAEHERDQAALAAAQASFDALRTRIGYAQVRAPTTGVITEKRVEAGDVVGTQARLFTIADVSTLVVRVQISELDVPTLRAGQQTDVTIDALGAERFQGTIRRIFPAADSATRMVPVEVQLSGTAVRRLRPGYLARVTLKLGERPGVLVAPIGAIVGARESRAVFVVHGNTVERRPVRLGQSSGPVVEILEGLKLGDSVVVVGADRLRDGDTVRVVAPIGEVAKNDEGERAP